MVFPGGVVFNVDRENERNDSYAQSVGEKG